MPYSNDILQAAKEQLAERRQSALRAADFRRESLFQDNIRLREIDRELYEIGAATAKAVLRPDQAVDMRRLSERSLALQEEQSRILSDLSLSRDMLEPHYICEKCHDTGYIELGDRTVTCDCLKKLMAEIACEQLNADLPLADCTFESFSLDYYGDAPNAEGKVPRSRMSNIYRYCQRYADDFTTASTSLLMRGATGLGKTHLSLAIANEVIRKGMSVVYVSAPDILSKLEREHFTYRYDEQEGTFRSLLNADLLIVDDLGTEFVTPFTVSSVYNLFNSRILSGKPIIINTNLTMTELLTTYSQRFVSRVIGACDTLEFIGEDIRPKL